MKRFEKLDFSRHIDKSGRALDSQSRGPRFESQWGQESNQGQNVIFHVAKMIHYMEDFILNCVLYEKFVSHTKIIITLFTCELNFHYMLYMSIGSVTTIPIIPKRFDYYNQQM